MSKFLPSKHVPAELVNPIMEVMGEFVGLVPGWCHRVNIHFVSENPEKKTVAQIIVWEEYREANLELYARWFDLREEFRREVLCHELIHIFIDPLASFANDVISRNIPDEKYKDHLMEQVRHLTECVTEDLTDAWLNGRTFGREAIYGASDTQRRTGGRQDGGTCGTGGGAKPDDGTAGQSHPGGAGGRGSENPGPGADVAKGT